MKKIVLITLSFMTVNMSIAQSDKQITNYMFDNMSFNPATTGFKGYCATAIYRGQWDKVENAPNTMLINVQGSLPSINSGIGISFMNDVIGLGVEREITLNYSFHLEVPNKGSLSAGLGVGIENVGFDPKWNGPTTGLNSQLDATLPLGASGTGLDVNFGLHWAGKDNKYYVGLSATHLTQPKLANVNFTKARHYYLMGGYNITTNNDFAYFLPKGMKITPSILYKTDAVAGILDFNVMMNHWLSGSSNNYGFYAGLTYRHSDAFAILLGLQGKMFSKSSVKNGGADSGALGQIGRKSDGDVWKIGYSYDVMTSALNQYGTGSHEIVFNYCVFPPAAAINRYGNVFILQ